MGSGAGATASRQDSTPSADDQEGIVAATLAPIGVTILPADFPRGFESEAPTTFTATNSIPSADDQEGIVAATLAPIGVTILRADFPRGFESEVVAAFTAASGSVRGRVRDLVSFSELPTRVKSGMLVYGDLGAATTALAAEG